MINGSSFVSRISKDLLPKNESTFSSSIFAPLFKVIAFLVATGIAIAVAFIDDDSIVVLVVDGLAKLLVILDRLGLRVVLVVLAFMSESSRLMTLDADETMDELDELEIIMAGWMMAEFKLTIFTFSSEPGLIIEA